MEWISVGDRLPTNRGRYKIKGFNDAFRKSTFEEVSTFIIRKNGTHYFNTCFDWKKATHWMPLPEPLK